MLLFSVHLIFVVSVLLVLCYYQVLQFILVHVNLPKNRVGDLILLDYFYDENLLFSDRQCFVLLVSVFSKRFRHPYPCFPFECSSLTRAHCRDLWLKLLSGNGLLRPSHTHHRAHQVTYARVNRTYAPSLLFSHRPTLPSLIHHHFRLRPL